MNYYDVQGRARGINNDTDVVRILDRNRRIYHSAFSGYLPDDKGGAIYEAACGPGILMRWLRGEGYKNVEGTDFSQCYVSIALSQGLEVRLADSIVDIASKPESSMDVVFALDFIEHIERDVACDFLRHVFRVLKPGGRLIMRMPNGDSPFVGRNFYNDVTHKWCYTTSAMTALTGVLGYSGVIYVDEAICGLPLWARLIYPMIWMTRGLSRLWFRFIAREDVRYFGSSIFVVVLR